MESNNLSTRITVDISGLKRNIEEAIKRVKELQRQMDTTTRSINNSLRNVANNSSMNNAFSRLETNATQSVQNINRQLSNIGADVQDININANVNSTTSPSTLGTTGSLGQLVGAGAMSQTANHVVQGTEAIRQNMSGINDEAQEVASTVQNSGIMQHIEPIATEGELFKQYLESIKQKAQAIINKIKGIDTSRIRKLGDEADNSSKKMDKLKSSAGGLKSILSKLGLALGITQLIRFGKQAVETASSLNEVQNVIDVVFGSEGSANIESWSKTVQKSFGLSELSAKQYAGTLGSMFSSMGIGQQNVLEMSKNMTDLAGDMASFYNITSDEAFSKLRSGVSGETEPLKQLGINLSQANLEAFALAQGYNQAYSSMSEANKAMVRYNYIMSTTSNAQGDFARTQAGFANQTRILSLRFTELKNVIGTQLIAVLGAVLPVINTILSGIMAIANAINSFFGLGQKATASFTAPMTSVADSVSDVGDAVSGVGDSAKETAKEMQKLMGFDEINILQQDSSSSGSGASGGGGSTGGAGGLDISPILPYEDTINNALDNIGARGQKILNSFKNALGGIQDMVTSIGQSWVNAWNSGVGESILDHVASIISHIFDGIGEVGRTFADVWDEIGTTVNTAVLNALDSILDLIDHVCENIGKIWDNGGKNLFEGMGKLGGQVLEVASNFISDWIVPVAEAISDVLVPVFSIISGAIGNVFKFIADNQWIIEVFLGLFTGFKAITFVAEMAKIIGAMVIAGIQAVISAGETAILMGMYAKDYILKGFALAQGLINAVMALNPFVLVTLAVIALIAVIVALWKKCDGFREFCYAVMKGLKDTWKGLCDTCKQVWEELCKGLKTAWQGFKDFFNNIVVGVKNIWNSCTSFVGNLWNNCVSGVKNIWNGVTSTFQNVFNKIKSIWSGITSALKKPIELAKDGIFTVVKAIRGFFDFSSWIKLPHFSMTGSLSPTKWATEGLPKLHVNWYEHGGLFDEASIIGVGENGRK